MQTTTKNVACVQRMNDNMFRLFSVCTENYSLPKSNKWLFFLWKKWYMTGGVMIAIASTVFTNLVIQYTLCYCADILNVFVFETIIFGPKDKSNFHWICWFQISTNFLSILLFSMHKDWTIKTAKKMSYRINCARCTHTQRNCINAPWKYYKLFFKEILVLFTAHKGFLNCFSRRIENGHRFNDKIPSRFYRQCETFTHRRIGNNFVVIHTADLFKWKCAIVR